MKNMRLQKFLLKYHPPTIGLEYTQHNKTKLKVIELNCITKTTDLKKLADNIALKESLITPETFDQFLDALKQIQGRIYPLSRKLFYKQWIFRGHYLPVTNVAIDKNGLIVATASYDRTCKLWNIDQGNEISSLQGHSNVVYCVCFSELGNKLLTGSFDKTARLWDVSRSNVDVQFWGHTAEVVCAKFTLDELNVITGSLDATAKLYQTCTGQEIITFNGHAGEIISVQINPFATNFITGSFDSTIRIWDWRQKRNVGTLKRHDGPISNCVYLNDLSIASSSLDKTINLWDLRKMQCYKTINAHDDEVLDLTYSESYKYLATASADGSAKIWDTQNNCSLISTMKGHRSAITRLMFSPITANYLLTASDDHTARLWETNTGNCMQILDGHSDDVFSCVFSYCGRKIITASKDNTCILWT